MNVVAKAWQNGVRRTGRSRLAPLGFVLAVLMMSMLPVMPAVAADEVAGAALPEWVEPNGLSVVDMIGDVPESHLRNAIIGAFPGGSFLQYISGERTGDKVTVRTKVTSWVELDQLTRFTCLGSVALVDSWGLVGPVATVRILQGNRDVTDRVLNMAYVPTGVIQPVGDATTLRYGDVVIYPKKYTGTGALELPAQMGCVIVMDGRYEDLTAVFEFYAPKLVRVEPLGSETFTFRAYSGPGDPGKLGSLQDQLRSLLGNRHDKFSLTIPEDADYVFLNFPPTPVNLYASGDIEANIVRPATGTYRLATDTGLLTSVDHVVSMGLPLHMQWRDADWTGGSYLELLRAIRWLTAPEYFVPVGIPYDPCMRFGGCSSDLLQSIANATMEMTIYYYRVTRVAEGLAQVRLRQVGPDWRATSLAAGAVPAEPEQVASAPGAALLPALRIFIPISPVTTAPTLPADNPDGCPCGWFAADGRMVDYVMPPQEGP